MARPAPGTAWPPATIWPSTRPCSATPHLLHRARRSFCARQGKNCGSVTGHRQLRRHPHRRLLRQLPSPLTCGGAGEDNVCGNGAVVDDGRPGNRRQPVQLLRHAGASCTSCGNGSLFNSSKARARPTTTSVTFAFTGVKAKLYGYKGPPTASAVSIDNGAETTVDFLQRHLHR
jgi:hypothetical protein